jgi:hypothetical protein
MELERMCKLIAAVCSALLALSCSNPERDEMRELLKDGQALVLTDADGNRYVVKHHFANSYTIAPVKK